MRVRAGQPQAVGSQLVSQGDADAATNAAREAARTRSRRARLLLAAADRTPVGDAPPAPDAELQSRRIQRKVQDALITLSEKERVALLMREEGFAQKEIAEAIGTTTKSMGTLLARALEKLSARLNLDQEEL